MNGDESRHDNSMHDGSDDYLWDRSGTPDPQLARLEQLLGTYRHAGALRTRGSRSLKRGRAWPRRHSRHWRIALAAAAVLAVCTLGLRAWYQQRLQWDAGHPWQVLAQGDGLRVDGHPVAGRTALAPQGLLETAPDTSARVRVAGIGRLLLGPDSRLRLLQTRSGRHRVALEQGTLWARVWAPPGQFGVDLAGADVIDLGCEFLLRIDAAGNGVLEVRSGWVQVDNFRREVLAPQGTRVRLHGNGAAGTPVAVDADPRFVAALATIDASGGAVAADGDVVRRLLAHARPADAISLLSLLQAYPQLGEGPMLQRLGQLLPTTPAATRANWRANRDALIEAWWQALPYPRVKRWWLQWPDALPAAVPGHGELEAMLRAPPAHG